MFFTPEFIKSDVPLAEYPRPQMKRDSYFSLNGKWDYAITKSPLLSRTFDGDVTVPYSPETQPSGVNRAVGADDYLHYRRFFTLPSGFNVGRVLLNVGACDQVCKVYVNGVEVGGHEGGYLPFAIDITDALKEENELRFVVRDDASSEIYGRGKQSYTPGGIWYFATSGLWQSVWLESVPEVYIKRIKLLPDYFAGSLKVDVDVEGNAPVTVQVVEDGETLASGRTDNGTLTLDVSACKPWSPDSPELYTLILTAGSDVVESYFGLRSFGRKEVGGYHYFTVNGKPTFHNGLLDQGYFEGGMYTPLSNERVYNELKAVKDLGYNMLRKHIKVESALWYYYCDVLGILVWQDMINGGGAYSKLRINLCPFINLHINDKNYRKMKRANPNSRKQFMNEAYGLIDTLYNCVSLCLWTPFNEAWGQFDAVDVWKELSAYDSSRLYDHASGWQDKGGGDVRSRHIYFRKARPRNDKKRVLALTEFGGYSFALGEHNRRVFGYKKFTDRERFTDAFIRLYENEVIPAIEKQALCGTVYTQLTDVEEEINGIFTVSRELKPSADRVKRVNEAVYEAFEKKVKE